MKLTEYQEFQYRRVVKDGRASRSSMRYDTAVKLEQAGLIKWDDDAGPFGSWVPTDAGIARSGGVALGEGGQKNG